MHDDGRKRVYVHPGQFFHAEFLNELTVQPDSAEKRVVHEIAETVGLGRLSVQNIEQIALGKAVSLPEFDTDVVREQSVRCCEAGAVKTLKVLLCILVQRGQRLYSFIGEV